MGNFGPTKYDMGGISPEDLAQGCYCLGRAHGGSDPYDKPPLYTMDNQVWVMDIEDSCWASFHFTIALELEFIAAMVGPAAGYQFTAAGNLDSNGTSITVSNDQVDSGIEFGFQVNVNYTIGFADNYGWSCEDISQPGNLETLYIDTKGQDSFDLIPLIKTALAAAGVSFNVQKIDANIYPGLNQTWGIVDSPHSGNVTSFPITAYCDLVAVLIDVGGPIGIALKVLRAALNIWDIYFKTGPGISATMQTTFTPGQLESSDNNRYSYSDLTLQSGSTYTGPALNPATPSGVSIWMHVDAQVGYGMTWVTQIGLDGIFDQTWQPTIDTTDLFDALDLTSPISHTGWALTPFGNRVPTSAPRHSSSLPGESSRVVFAAAGGIG